MRDSALEARLSAVRRLLDREGVQGEVSAVGLDGEIAAVQCGPDQRGLLAALAPEIRSMGFRYVALESNAEDHHDEES